MRTLGFEPSTAKQGETTPPRSEGAPAGVRLRSGRINPDRRLKRKAGGRSCQGPF